MTETWRGVLAGRLMRTETWEVRLKYPDGVTRTTEIKGHPKVIDWMRSKLGGHWKKTG